MGGRQLGNRNGNYRKQLSHMVLREHKDKVMFIRTWKLRREAVQSGYSDLGEWGLGGAA